MLRRNLCRTAPALSLVCRHLLDRHTALTASGNPRSSMSLSLSTCTTGGTLQRSSSAFPTGKLTTFPSTTSGSIVTSKRYNLFLNGRSYHPNGLRMAALKIKSNQPEMEEHFNSLAKTAHQTNNYGDALSLYDRVLSYRRETYGDTDVRCAATLNNIGRLFLDMKDPVGAERALMEACAIYDLEDCRAAGGPDRSKDWDPNLTQPTDGAATTLNPASGGGATSDPASTFIRLSMSNELNALRQSATLNQYPHSLKYADSLGLLGLAYRDGLQFEQAELTFKEALVVYQSHCWNPRTGRWLPDNTTVAPEKPNLHPLASVAHVLSDCATMFVNQGQLDRATVFLEEALDIRRYLYGSRIGTKGGGGGSYITSSAAGASTAVSASSSAASKFRSMIAQTLLKLTEVKRSQGHLIQAEIYINECVDICLESMGRDSPATASAMSGKGNVLLVKRDYRGAQKCYEEAVTTYALVFGKESALVANELIHVAKAQECQGDLNGAAKSLEKSMNITAASSLGAEHLQTSEAQFPLSGIWLKQGKYAEAIDAIKNSIKIRTTKCGPKDPQLTYMYHRLGDALAALKSPDAEANFLIAIDMYREQIAAMEAESAPGGSTTDGTASPHRSASITAKGTEAVDASTSSPLLKSSGARGPQLMVTDALDDLGLFYIQFKHFAPAKERLHESLKIRLEHLGDNHPAIAYSYSNLALLACGEEDWKNGLVYGKKAFQMFSDQSRAASISHASATGSSGGGGAAATASGLGSGSQATRLSAQAAAVNWTSLNMALADISTTIGQCYYGLKQYPVAIQHFEQALHYRKILGEQGGGSNELTLSELYHLLGRSCLEEAITLITPPESFIRPETSVLNQDGNGAAMTHPQLIDQAEVPMGMASGATLASGSAAGGSSSALSMMISPEAKSKSLEYRSRAAQLLDESQGVLDKYPNVSMPEVRAGLQLARERFAKLMALQKDIIGDVPSFKASGSHQAAAPSAAAAA